MRIAIFGTGGVGGYFGGRLAQAGEEAWFIARGEHLRAMREQGLRVDSLRGDFHLQPVRATADPAEVGEVDLVLVCVKAWQLPEAAEAMRPMVGPGTTVLPLLNGVEAPTILGAVLGRERVLGGLCRIIAFLAGPGHVRHAGVDPVIRFGELDNRRSARVEELLRVFSRCEGFAAGAPDDIQAAMWQKFLFIVASSGVGSITRVPVGVYRSQPETRRMLEQVIREIDEVARTLDVSLPPDAVEKTLEIIDRLPAQGTASMQRDVMNGRPSELEAQTGAVVRLGREAGVATPVNELIYASLLPMELRARGRIRTRL